MADPPREAPTFLFAYANDRHDDRRFLRNLSEERRRIKQALQGASDQGLCTLIECAGATLAEVLDECQRHARSLTVLHFAGHASSASLFFETAEGRTHTVSATSFTQFLGGIRGLKLVFLNGCSTKAQVEALRSQGVAAVVATSSSVPDRIATELAVRFYKGLEGGATIRDAFHQATGAVLAAFGEEALGRPGAIDAPRDAGEVPGVGAEHPPFPWELFGEPDALARPLIAARSADRTRCQIVITATLDQFDAAMLARVTAELQQISGDLSLKITKIESGSVRLHVTVSEAGGRRLSEAWARHELTALCGFEVKAIELSGPTFAPEAPESRPEAPESRPEAPESRPEDALARILAPVSRLDLREAERPASPRTGGAAPAGGWVPGEVPRAERSEELVGGYASPSAGWSHPLQTQLHLCAEGWAAMARESLPSMDAAAAGRSATVRRRSSARARRGVLSALGSAVALAALGTIAMLLVETNTAQAPPSSGSGDTIGIFPSPVVDPLPISERVELECQRLQEQQRWRELEACADRLTLLAPGLAAELKTRATEEERAAPRIVAVEAALRDNDLKRASGELAHVWTKSVEYPRLKGEYESAESEAVAVLVRRLTAERKPGCVKYEALLENARRSAPPRVANEAARRVPCEAPPPPGSSKVPSSGVMEDVSGGGDTPAARAD